MVKDTSLNTYIQLKEYLGDLQIQIFRIIVENPAITRREIEEKSEIPINSVCGRVKELMDAGLVIVAGNKQCKISGRIVESLTSVNNINWKLLNIRIREKKTITPLLKEHIPIIYKLYEIATKSIGGEENLDKYGNKKMVEQMKNLREYILDKNQDLSVFEYGSTSEEMNFYVESDSREMFHEVKYNLIEKKFICSCENYKFKKINCKHINRVIKKYKIEVR